MVPSIYSFCRPTYSGVGERYVWSIVCRIVVRDRTLQELIIPKNQIPAKMFGSFPRWFHEMEVVVE